MPLVLHAVAAAPILREAIMFEENEADEFCIIPHDVSGSLWLSENFSTS